MANKQLNVLLSVKDQYSKEMGKFNNALKVNKSELKLVDEQLKANSKDSEALATKQKLLVKETELLSNQQKSTANMLRVSNAELEKQASKCNSLEKELKDLESQYKKNVKELGNENKLTQASLKTYEKKRKELSSANKQYNTLEKSVTNLNVKMNNLNTSHVKASNEFARTTLEIQNMDKAADKADKSLDKLTKKDYTKIADGMMKAGVALGTALVGMGTLGANESIQFEYGQAKIGSIVDVSQEELSNLGNTVIETSNKFGIASKDIQNSIYQALSSSVKFEDVQGVLDQSIKLSKGGFASLTPTLDVLTNIMNSYGKSASDVQSISDALFKTTVVGKTTIEQLATQFSGLSVIAANTEVSLEQALSGLALLTQSGTSTSEAVTQIRALLNELGNDTTKVGQQVKNNLGMSFQDAMKNGAKLDDILLGLDKSAKSSGSSLSNMLGSVEAKQAAMQIMTDNGQKFDATLQQIANSAGATQEAFDKVDSTKMADMEKSVQKLKNSMLSVGEAVAPYIDVVSDGIEKISDVIKETDKNTVNLLATISAVTLGLGATLKVTSSIKNALTVIKPLIGAVGLGFGQVALISGGIAVVVGIFDALNTTLDEQNKKLEKAETNLANVKSEYDKLANSSNRTEAQEKILRGLEKEIELNEKILAQEKEKTIRNKVFGAGRIGIGELGKTSGLQADIEYTKNTIKDLEEQYKRTSDKITKDLLTVEIGKQYQILATYTEEFNGKMEVLNGAIDVATDKEKKQIDKLNEWANTLGLIDDELPIESIQQQTEEFVQQQTELEELIEKANIYAQKQQDVNSVVEDYNNTGHISSNVISELVSKYPELQEQISFVGGEYKLNEEAINSLMNTEKSEVENAIINQIAKTESAIENTRTRMSAINTEIANVKTLAEAYTVLGGLMSTAQQEAEKFQAGARKDAYVYASGGVSQKTKKELNAMAEMAGMLKKIESLQGSLNDLNISTPQIKSPKSSRSSSSSPSSSRVSKDDLFNREIQQIQQYRKKLKDEIAILQEQINIDKLLGVTDEVKLDTFSNKLKELQLVAQKEIDRFSKLKLKFTSDEQQLKLNELISQSTQAKYQDEQEYLQNSIDLIHRKADLEKRAYDDKIKQIELEQIMMDENGKEYQAKEEEKYALLLGVQQSYQDKIRELKAKGYNNEQEDVRKFINLWVDAEEERLNMLKSMAEKRREIEIQASKDKVDSLEKQKNAIKETSDSMIAMIKKETELKKKAIQDEIDGYSKIINAKKEALRDEQDDKNYQKGLSEKEKAIKKVKDKLAELEYDDTAKGEKAKLNEELKKLEDELLDYMDEQSIKNKEETLDKELELFEKEKQEEIDKLDDFLSKEGEIRKKAMELIENGNKTLYEKLLKYNATYGDKMQSEIIDAWDTAQSALEDYGGSQDSLLESLKNITDEMERQVNLQKQMTNSHWTEFDDNYNSSGGKNNSSTIQKMISNSEKWNNTNDPKEKAKLANENLKLGDSIGAYKDATTGVWYTDKSKKVRLFHSGGLVDGTNNKVKSNEVFAKVLKTEGIFTQRQMDGFMTRTLPAIAGYNFKQNNSKGDITISKLFDVVIQGNVDKGIDIEKIIKRASERTMDDLLDTLRNAGY